MAASGNTATSPSQRRASLSSPELLCAILCAIAAAHAALKYIIQEGPALQQRVTAKADRFAGQVNQLFKKYELDIELPHFASQMYLRIKEPAELANLLCFHLRHRGVHIAEGFPSYMTDAHSEQDIEHLVRAFTDSVEVMVEDGIFGNPSKLLKESGAEKKTYSSPAVSAHCRTDARPGTR